LNKPKIAHVDREQPLPDLLVSFPGLTKEELPNGEAWAVEKNRIDNARRNTS
jgi:hypothetical protein